MGPEGFLKSVPPVHALREMSPSLKVKSSVTSV